MTLERVLLGILDLSQLFTYHNTLMDTRSFDEYPSYRSVNGTQLLYLRFYLRYNYRYTSDLDNSTIYNDAYTN